ncbi:hypothetical protein [Clostridium beijerinckii]|uniref:hypothetical protein n=1 Tax=Clostridium beijerinckii TaxID=1520 RepID=UPI0003D34FE2|nr:hypothetical protein [Clostridium beijerinckii]ALB44527.1 hypothetical protein X276_04145 [Clostridium beijerinckii NRRL B-598]
MDNNKITNNELINELIECINFVIKKIDDMCHNIYKGEGNRIFDGLDEFINGLDFIITKINYVSDEIEIKKIDEMLICLEKAIFIKDYVLLTDVLIYELKTMLKRWVELLETTLGNA